MSDIWITATIGFFSVFRDARKKSQVLIRARAKADIYNFPHRHKRDTLVETVRVA